MTKNQQIFYSQKQTDLEEIAYFFLKSVCLKKDYRQSKPAFTYSKLIMETLEQCVKYVHSYQ